MPKEYEINVETRVAALWRLMQYAVDDIPHCYPPPVTVEYTPEKEFDRVKNMKPGEITDFLCAQMFTSHVSTALGIEPTRYKMIVYIDWFNRYLQTAWGKKISKIAVQVLVDHILIHELFHYSRNVEVYLKICGHQQDAPDYDNRLKGYYEYWKHAGEEEDEEATETLATSLLEEIYNVRSDLKPVWTGRFAQYKERRQPGYIDRLSMINYLRMDNILLQLRMNNGPEAKIQNAAKFCREIIEYHTSDTRDDLVIPKLIYQ